MVHDNYLVLFSSLCCPLDAGFRLTRFRRTSEVDLIPGPEQSFDIVGGYFSADLKPFLRFGYVYFNIFKNFLFSSLQIVSSSHHINEYEVRKTKRWI
jgi:hypothetical protein